MAIATLESTAEENLFATCVYQNSIEPKAVFNNIGPHRDIQVIHHLKPEATGHLSTSVNQTDETKLLIQLDGVNLQLVVIINM